MHVAVNGTKLFFDVDGAKFVPDGREMREKPSLIVLHGGPGHDHSIFKTGFVDLTDIAQVIYLDHRGNGRSVGSGPETWNLAQWGDDVKGLCDALEITRPIVYGASFGGFVAQAYATRHPHHPAALVLTSTAAKIDFARVFAAFEELGGPSARRAAEDYWSEPTPETGLRYRQICVPLYRVRPNVDPDAQHRTINRREVGFHFNGPNDEHGRMDFRHELGAIQCPVLVMAGDRDPVTPIGFSDEIATCLPPHLVQVERFENCGHGVLGDATEVGFAKLRRFIEAQLPLR